MNNDNIKPNWRMPDDFDDDLYAGDRIVAVVRWSDPPDENVARHIITFTVDEGNFTDSEGLGYTLDDCECWMPEVEFLKLLGLEMTGQ